MKRPLALSDHQMSLVRRAAAALPENARDELLRAVAAHLSESPSDAAVAAVVNAQLDRNLTPMFLTDSAPRKGTTP
jgi:hypothetical protein